MKKPGFISSKSKLLASCPTNAAVMNLGDRLVDFSSPAYPLKPYQILHVGFHKRVDLKSRCCRSFFIKTRIETVKACFNQIAQTLSNLLALNQRDSSWIDAVDEARRVVFSAFNQIAFHVDPNLLSPGLVSDVESFSTLENTCDECVVTLKAQHLRREFLCIGNTINEQVLLENAVLILSTVASSGNMFLRFEKFKAVIIDEAAQLVESALLISLRTCTKKLILVGDPQQLPATVLSSLAKHRGYSRPLFQRIIDCQNENLVNLLIWQYRMHPSISKFPCTTFYQGKILDHESTFSKDWREFVSMEDRQLHRVMGSNVFVDVRFCEEIDNNSRSFFNSGEA